MAHSTQKQVRPDKAFIPPTVMLALWRVRRTWGLLLLTGIGVICSVMFVCAVPLYSDVAMTAGLRGAIRSAPENADIYVQGLSDQVSAPVINTLSKRIDQKFQKQFGSYIGSQQLSIITSEFTVLNRENSILRLFGNTINQAASHVQLVQGRLPRISGSVIELAITQETASDLHASVGSVLQIEADFFTPTYSSFLQVSRTLNVAVVGIVKLNEDDYFWHQNTLQPAPKPHNPTTYTGIASNETLLSVFMHMYDDAALQGLIFLNSPTFEWYYRFDTSHITVDNLDDLKSKVQAIEVNVATDVTLSHPPYIHDLQTILPSDILESYHNRLSVAGIPVLSLLCMVLGLVLYFVSMMADFLVDRQLDAIAILRNRGASPQQIFGSLVTQSIGIGLIALVAGPLLAILLVRFMLGSFVALRMSTMEDQGALTLIAGNPVQGALRVGWYALATVLVAVLAMIIAVARTMEFDVLSLRREASRSTRRPIWQRLNLDVVAAIIMLAGYGYTFYLTHSNAYDIQVRLLLVSPLTLVGTIFLTIAGMLLFLRFFPLFLRWGSQLAGRSRGAAAGLALAQMARSPRQSLRMTLLLALATAFAIFTLVFTASQYQRILDVANHQSGADFSGAIAGTTNSVPLPVSASEIKQRTMDYRHIPGVLSATVGFAGQVTATKRTPVELRAVDADTFAQTAIWTGENSSQSLTALIAQLSTRRASAIASNVVPAIVDNNLWNALQLSPTGNFTLKLDEGPVNFIAIARVNLIPTVNDSGEQGVSSSTLAAGGLLVDYQSCYTVYAKSLRYASGAVLPLNYAWLRTQDDAASLASVRKALGSVDPRADLQLDPLFDRRAIISSLQNEPLYLTLIGVLTIGATIALILALVGSLIASWLNARSRLINFAVLRALGAVPQQIASVLTWEQSIIYTTSLLLGMIFGAVLCVLIVPALIFTSVNPENGSNTITNGTFFAIQNIPPIRIVIPSSLGIALGILIAICVVALSMMLLMVSRPSISQALRLNED